MLMARGITQKELQASKAIGAEMIDRNAVVW
jgi:hypothetical protein